MPIIATAVQEELVTGSASSGDASSAASTVRRCTQDTDMLHPGGFGWSWEGRRVFIPTFESPTDLFRPSPVQAEKHHSALVKVLCSELGVDPEALLDFELCLTDTQPGVRLQIIHTE